MVFRKPNPYALEGTIHLPIPKPAPNPFRSSVDAWLQVINNDLFLDTQLRIPKSRYHHLSDHSQTLEVIFFVARLAMIILGISTTLVVPQFLYRGIRSPISSNGLRVQMKGSHFSVSEPLQSLAQLDHLRNLDDCSTLQLQRNDGNISIYCAKSRSPDTKQGNFTIRSPDLHIGNSVSDVIVDYSCTDAVYDFEISPPETYELHFGPQSSDMADYSLLSGVRARGTSLLNPLDSSRHDLLIASPMIAIDDYSLLYTQIFPAYTSQKSDMPERIIYRSRECVIRALSISPTLMAHGDDWHFGSAYNPSEDMSAEYLLVHIPDLWARGLYEIYIRSQPHVCQCLFVIDEHAVELLSLLLGLGLSSREVKYDDSDRDESLPEGILADYNPQDLTSTSADRSLTTFELYSPWFIFWAVQICLAITWRMQLHFLMAFLYHDSQDIKVLVTSVIRQTATVNYHPLRLRLKSDMTRLEWTCGCGERLYGDFEQATPGSLQSLARQLGSTSLQPNIGLDASGTALTGSLNDNGTSPKTEKPSHINHSFTGYSRPDNGSQITATATRRRNIPLRTGHKFLEICMSGRNQFHKLEEVVSSRDHKPTDRSMFEAIREKYVNHRKSSFLSGLSLHSPSGANFIRLQTFEKDLVSVIRKEPLFPPETEVLEGRYEYEPIPMNEPPMPSNVFLHYLNHDHEAHNTSLWSARFPYRLGESLVGTNSRPMTMAWGVEIEEGPNMLIFSLLAILGLLLAGAVAAVYGILMQDPQTAVAIGAWLTAIETLIIMILFFRWAER